MEQRFLCIEGDRAVDDIYRDLRHIRYYNDDLVKRRLSALRY